LVRVQPMGPLDGGATSVVREPKSTSTDADGRFELTDLQPGRYIVTATRNTYVPSNWGQTQSGAPGTPLDVHAGEVNEHVDFSLQRGGVVTGRIVDEFGEPMSSLQVTAMQTRLINGKRDLIQMGFATTDDLGEFRIFGLAPGQYSVKATWRRPGPPPDPTSPDRTGYPETFFPGTTEADQAQRFTLRAGQTVSDLAMALSPIATARVEGTIVDADGRPMTGTTLIVGKTSGNSGFFSGGPVRPDGTFVVASLTPGEYLLRTQPMPPRKDVATMKLTVGTEDIKDVRLVAMPPSTISGRVIIDPAQAPSLPNAVQLTAMPIDGQVFGGMMTARVGDDLSFELTAAAGHYRINWVNQPPGWTIRAIRINNVDVTDDDVDVKAGENITGVDIELTNRTATISGLVTAAGGTPAKDYTVIVFAADSKRWTPNSRYLRIGRPDQDGRFKVTGLAPADYSVIAIERVETPGQWNDPEFLQRLSPKASGVTLMEGETRTIELKLSSGS
ncbi:MAG TPA: carboxypeptidase-like regulatory domain-containing protein, partial [Vicinamibacterales bacterium]|nr:carboxypeptidase-like regulatory domain-containing protein [Vicinamibacterales bacterium]